MLRLGQLRAAWGIQDVNAILPSAVILAGIVFGATGQVIGFGIAVGSLLAALNSIVLAKRVQLAVDSSNAAVATVSMQVGLMLTFVFVGGVTLLTLIISVPMAAAMGVTFFAVQTAEIVLFYWTRTAADRANSGVVSTLKPAGDSHALGTDAN